MIGKGTVTISLELAKFIKSRTNHGFVFGVCMAAMMSGYAPMSQGWWEFMGHGAVKNWKWLWGTTTWFDTLGYAGIKAADMAQMGSFGGLSNAALMQLIGLVRSVIDKLHGKPEALETSESLPEISDLYRAAEEALHSSDDEDESMRRYRAFRQKFDKLDPAMRDAYLLKVYSKGMRRKMQKEMASQPLRIEDQSRSAPRPRRQRAIMPASSSTSVMPYGMNNVRLPNTAFPYSDTEQSESAGPSTGPRQQSLSTPTRLVSYAPGVRQSKRGRGKTIQGLAPVLEFNEAADDPYLMRQQAH
jgi:hypothetical protein